MPSDQTPSDGPVQPDMDLVAQLIQTAGRREDPPAEAYRETLAVATAALHRKIRRRRQRWWATSLAASVVVAAVIAWLIGNQPPAPVAMVARMERIIGMAELQVANADRWTTLADETGNLASGSLIRTREQSRAGLVLASGVSLRLAEATTVTLESASRLRLLEGKVYLDSGAGADRRAEVVTAAGTASDLGTQFEVAYGGNTYRLRVREGRVLFRQGPEQVESTAGEQFSIDPSGAVQRTRIAANDAEWQWVESVAPAPDIENQPVTVLLEWVARETGRSVRFEEPGVERKAAGTILHGNIRHLAPLEALSVMLATTDLQYVILEDGTILIGSKPVR